MTKLELDELAEWKRRLDNPQPKPTESCQKCWAPQPSYRLSKEEKRENEQYSTLLAKVLKELGKPC